MTVAAPPHRFARHRPTDRTHRGDHRAGGAALRLVPPAQQDDRLAALTPRQREVLELMAAGLSNAAIARHLVLTERAIVQHCSNIYAALDLTPSTDEHRRVLAVLRHVGVEPEARS